MKNLRLRDLEEFVGELSDVRIFKTFRNKCNELDYEGIYIGELRFIPDNLKDYLVSSMGPCPLGNRAYLYIYLKEK